MPGFNPTLARDLLLLGMMYVADASFRRDVRPLRALTFLYAFQGLGLIADRKARQLLMKDGASIQQILDVSYKWAGRKPKKRELQRLGQVQDEAFVLIVPGAGVVDNARVLGGNGYFLYITDAGLAQAEAIESAYAPRVNPISFNAAWENSLRQLGAMHTRFKRQGGKSNTTNVSAGSSEFSIPPAIAQREWMWDD